MSDLVSFENQITTAVEKLSESVVSIDSVRVARNFGYGFVQQNAAAKPTYLTGR